MFQIDTVQAVADQVGGLQGGAEDLGRYCFEGQGLEIAFLELAAAAVMLEDLPVLLDHVVLAGEQQLAVEDADAPVVVGRHELLGDDQL